MNDLNILQLNPAILSLQRMRKIGIAKISVVQNSHFWLVNESSAKQREIVFSLK